MMKYVFVLLLAFGATVMYASYLRQRLQLVLRVHEEERLRQRRVTAANRISGPAETLRTSPRYTHNPDYFRLIGSPITGIQFEKDRVIFVHVRPQGTQLTESDRRLRALVQAGMISWEEYEVAES